MAQQLHRHTLPRGSHQDYHVDSTPITQPICVPPYKMGKGLKNCPRGALPPISHPSQGGGRAQKDSQEAQTLAVIGHM